MKHYIGIDVSKAKLDVLWLRDHVNKKVKTRAFPNKTGHFHALIEWIKKNTKSAGCDVHVVLEATSIYHEAVALFLFKEGFNVSVVNPARPKEFAKSLGIVHKTDKSDSYVLASYGRTIKPSLWQPEPDEIRALKAILARLQALEEDLIRETNRLEKAGFSQASEFVIESLEAMIKNLRFEKKRLEAEVNDHIDKHPHLKRDRQLLESIPGIGEVLSRLMLSVIHSRSFTTGDQVAAYLGVIPVLQESGVFKGRSRMSKRGPAKIRAKLYMAAIVASQYNPDIICQKKRLLKSGKTKMQALGAAMRKLVKICFGVLKHQGEYQPQAV